MRDDHIFSDHDGRACAPRFGG